MQSVCAIFPLQCWDSTRVRSIPDYFFLSATDRETYDFVNRCHPQGTADALNLLKVRNFLSNMHRRTVQ